MKTNCIDISSVWEEKSFHFFALIAEMLENYFEKIPIERKGENLEEFFLSLRLGFSSQRRCFVEIVYLE
jgi:hypothetical protein